MPKLSLSSRVEGEEGAQKSRTDKTLILQSSSILSNQKDNLKSINFFSKWHTEELTYRGHRFVLRFLGVSLKFPYLPEMRKENEKCQQETEAKPKPRRSLLLYSEDKDKEKPNGNHAKDGSKKMLKDHISIHVERIIGG